MFITFFQDIEQISKDIDLFSYSSLCALNSLSNYEYTVPLHQQGGGKNDNNNAISIG